MTFAAAKPMIPPKGGDCMKGSVQFHAPAKRYYISWYPVRIWKNPITGEPFWHEKNAIKILDKMRCEEEVNHPAHTFRKPSTADCVPWSRG